MIGVFMIIQSEYGIRRPIDDSLIEKISHGDTDAFRDLYESASKSVYGFALSILKNRFDAEDVLQDTFLRVYANASGYKAKGKPMAWILRITRNLALTRLREKSKNTICNGYSWNCPCMWLFFKRKNSRNLFYINGDCY